MAARDRPTSPPSHGRVRAGEWGRLAPSRIDVTIRPSQRTRDRLGAVGRTRDSPNPPHQPWEGPAGVGGRGACWLTRGRPGTTKPPHQPLGGPGGGGGVRGWRASTYPHISAYTVQTGVRQGTPWRGIMPRGERVKARDPGA
ncbi:hypothetical protein GWK47_001936 [Chionoecetes opilio]|uniref:Uncharacterized protein n=1 Tax=Chionoecetes opilio TaxID=41210 RepID=A0A8J4XRZ6_CHIOP|nr:hypothetical protein GWK47_001936 [Chionoecetes opilio]